MLKFSAYFHSDFEALKWASIVLKAVPKTIYIWFFEIEKMTRMKNMIWMLVTFMKFERIFLNHCEVQIVHRPAPQTISSFFEIMTTIEICFEFQHQGNTKIISVVNTGNTLPEFFILPLITKIWTPRPRKNFWTKCEQSEKNGVVG